MKKITLLLASVVCAFVANAGVYLAGGNINNWNGADPNWELADNGDGTFVLKDKTIPAGEFKVVANGDWMGWGNGDGWNYKLSTSTYGRAFDLYKDNNNLIAEEDIPCAKIVWDGKNLTLYSAEKVVREIKIKGAGFGNWGELVALTYGEESGDYSYTETEPAKFAQEFGLDIANIGFARFADTPQFNLADCENNTKSGRMVIGAGGNMKIQDAENFESITLTVKEDDGVFTLTVTGVESEVQNPLAGAAVEIGAVLAGTEAVNVTLGSAALDEFEGSVLKYRVSDMGEQTYDETALPTLTTGGEITAWVEMEQDGKVFKSAEFSGYPFIVAFIQPEDSNWEEVAVYTHDDVLVGAWPGKQLEPELYNGYYTSWCTFVASSYSIEDGYRAFIIFNDNKKEGAAQLDDVKVSKIYTVFNGDAQDVTETLGDVVSGVEEVADSNVTVAGGRGEIIVRGAGSVAVYAVSGALVSREANAKVPAGIYIVKADNQIAKVIVK